MSFTLAIVGRPNVGKSTLFNRLVGRRLALVDDRPGVTRDRREGQARLGDLAFTAVDTAGFDEAAPGSLTARSRIRNRPPTLAVPVSHSRSNCSDVKSGLTPRNSEVRIPAKLTDESDDVDRVVSCGAWSSDFSVVGHHRCQFWLSRADAPQRGS